MDAQTDCPPDHPHNASCYTNHACRCSRCRKANAEKSKRRRRERDPSTLPDSKHGKATTYNNWGCRCERCTKAWADACRRYPQARPTANKENQTVDDAQTDTLSEMDAARAAARQSAETVLGTVSALLAELYPEAAYATVHAGGGFARIGGIYTAQGHRHEGLIRRGRTVFPPHRIGEWPLSRFPKRITRPLLGPHADDGSRTLNGVLTDAWRAGARVPAGYVGRHLCDRLKLR
ncbi:hypothetical protein OOK44_36170 [Streptomyces cellulosae]|uniref:Uncharacterized protein n=1 Tax=Streptomyces althioticus TaxID=83380 RepID=A0ABZ1YI51_9ACTN|nr:hypothetical protein [Streptomyces cellulosae]WTB93440.1 hypothetical protein OIE99_34920 [Streptomyces cellulosae]WTC60831.1 hypothetical protein OH715_36670 [Streptomyces cellulosae]